MLTRIQDGRTNTIPLVVNETFRPSRTKRSYLPVESVQRALLILKLLNEMEIAQVHQLSRKTGVHKATIVRMLETLMSEGYVLRDECLGGYCLTSSVRSLSVGFSGRMRFIELARNHLIELTRETKWPASIAFVDSDEVILRFSTSPISCWSYPFNVIGQSMDIITSAAGRASLAYCDDAQREKLIDSRAAATGVDKQAFLTVNVSPLVAGVRRAGYALSLPAQEEQRFRFVAVPVFGHGRFLAAIEIGHYKSVVPKKDIYANFVEPLLATAEAIRQVWESS